MGKAFVNLLRECTDHTRSLHDWWLEYGASDSATALILDCATGPWEIPWELFGARFANASNRRRLRIVRTLGPGAAPIAKRQSARLRILVLQGSDGRARGAAIDLEREARNLSEAWKGLESQVRDKIDEPVVIPALERTFSGELRDKAQTCFGLAVTVTRRQKWNSSSKVKRNQVTGSLRRVLLGTSRTLGMFPSTAYS